LTGIENIHLTSDKRGELKDISGNLSSVKIIFLIALIIVFIISINYINLTTAKSLDKMKYVAIKKIVGASRLHLFKQFLFEAILLNLISFIVAFLLTIVILHYFNSILGVNISLSVIINISYWVIIIAFICTMAFISGVIPALIISSFKPVQFLKGKSFVRVGKGSILRKALVIFQFVLLLVMISFILAVYNQINFMQHGNMGIDKGNILLLRTPINSAGGNLVDRKIIFKDEISKLPEISSVSVSHRTPGMILSVNESVLKENGEYEIMNGYLTDDNFNKVYNLELLAGRWFDESFSDNYSLAVINKNSLQFLGFENPQESIGKYITSSTRGKKQIIGVVNDFYNESLKEELKPVIFFYEPNIHGYFSIKYKTDNIQQLIKNIEVQWEVFFEEDFFDYFFLEEIINNQYKDEIRLGKITLYFSFLSLIIACLGLFGLTYYSTSIRVREIVIRKILGSSISNILLLLNRDILKLIFISFIIATPIAYWQINNWLNNYPNKIDIKWTIFILPIIIVLFIALFTTSFVIIKVTLANPINSLNEE
jgi:putative ABC transport system permease protein